jgi:putative nucleotidyltransferase with HDIG domain
MVVTAVAEGTSMHDTVRQLWPEIDWIEDAQLREQVAKTWALALERGTLKPNDLEQIPFTLLVPNCPITFMRHKRCVVHIARASALFMQEFMGRALPVNIDVVIAGAILADVGKLLEYEVGSDGKARQSERGEALRHPFTGVALALECGVPDSVCHIIAAHAGEGDLVKRSTEAFIVHHADFMAFLPFKNPRNIRIK